jgi:hypothetical protein
MKDNFYSPYLIWSGIWLLICLVVLIISAQANKLYWEADKDRGGLAGYRGSYGVFAERFGPLPEAGDHSQFPFLQRYVCPGPPAPGPLRPFLEPQPPGYEGGYFFFRPQGSPSFLETVWSRHNWRQAWEHQPHATYFFVIISYLLFVVGFGAICFITALYQDHFRKAREEQFETEIEARNLRIQVLESSRNALDLRLTLLDQVHEKTLATAREAQETISNLEGKLRSEAHRNEALQAQLQRAREEESAALRLLRVLDDDREKIAAEQTDLLSRLVEAEKMGGEDPYGQRTGKAKKRVRLNSSWLQFLYRKLSFSPRALQNLNEIQEAPDVFPSLPDALGIIDNLTLEELESGANLPPKTVARFATQDLEHFQGPFWEYRFSSHGRIFFGLSRSRTWNIDTILLKRRFPDKKEKYDRYLATTLGRDNQDLRREILP